ncbi:hypothetical protein [Pseudobacteriovorax antillogorgiicola]|uniref:Secreted protein n=1 Tax=Pseudobacteriovorax antillogorgiicola TaxID=1513793 RepID=A0A1Y6B6T4_9BACT|nr:hypothetical protein [Pseudobacteriovorax antillogorgiicola]TCS58743.1 hypothetical protein EDD56_102257 [Pseudobacteriovorax antillogorgiicola]SME95227.1 hypothetical protein SAMN06296036_102186 [Pseudobacteriovorax antillogorgiicola]
MNKKFNRIGASVFSLLLSVDASALVTRVYCDKASSAYPYNHTCRTPTKNDFIHSLEACRQKEKHCRRGAGGTGSGNIVLGEWFRIDGEELIYPRSLARNVERDCKRDIYTQSDWELEYELEACEKEGDRSIGRFKLRLQCTFNASNPEAGACEY